ANAIKFSVVANNASRSAEYWCNYNLPKQFNVWAAVGGKTYFKNESFKLNSGSWQIEGDYRYWPAEEVTFFAAKIKGDKETDTENFATFKWLNDANQIAPTITMETKDKASEQHDLLYAVTKSTRTEVENEQVTKNYKNGVATLNFRHALSQVVFYAKNENPNIYVEIDEVVVCNVNSKGTFSYKYTDGDPEPTDGNLENHTQEGSLTDKKGVGKWSDQNTKYTATTDVLTTAAKVQARKVDGEGKITTTQADRVNLTDNTAGKKEGDTTTKEDATHSLLLIPQTVDAWNPATTKDPDKAAVGKEGGEGYVAGQTGAYFKVKCTIKNVAKGDGSAAADDDLYVWADKVTTTEDEGESQVTKVSYKTKYIYVPVKIDWATGKKYIYTILFTTTGHGGYDENGDPVLIPIKFNLTVDDFAAGTDNTVNTDSGIVSPVTTEP
ncbi:MAG: hypothetical protein ACI30S_06035, partial [Muribaculaceae bacterium]